MYYKVRLDVEVEARSEEEAKRIAMRQVAEGGGRTVNVVASSLQGYHREADRLVEQRTRTFPS